jgi:hypothetical protein
MIGLAIMGLIFIPLLALLIAALLEPKRTPKTPIVAAMFTGSVLVQVIAMIVGFAIIAMILKFIVPQ